MSRRAMVECTGMGLVSPLLVLCVMSLGLHQQTDAAPGRSVPGLTFQPSSHSLSLQSNNASRASPHKKSSNSPKDALSRLSKVFGISRIPERSILRSPPQYMRDLYNTMTETGGLSKKSGPFNSNVIRSFPDKGMLYTDFIIILHGPLSLSCYFICWQSFFSLIFKLILFFITSPVLNYLNVKSK